VLSGARSDPGPIDEVSGEGEQVHQIWRRI
jgi:hypothetical protein